MQSKHTQETLFPACNVTPAHIPTQGPTDIPATYLLLNKKSNYDVLYLICFVHTGTSLGGEVT